jgi:hypothetical protein
MTLKVARSLQDHAQSDDRYLCVLIGYSNVGSSSMQLFPCYHQAYVAYLYQDQYICCASYFEAIGRTIDLA